MIYKNNCRVPSELLVKSVQIRSFFWYGPEKTPYLDTFHAVKLYWNNTLDVANFIRENISHETTYGTLGNGATLLFFCSYIFFKAMAARIFINNISTTKTTYIRIRITPVKLSTSSAQIFADFIFAVCNLFCEIKFGEFWGKRLIRENKFCDFC